MRQRQRGARQQRAVDLDVRAPGELLGGDEAGVVGDAGQESRIGLRRDGHDGPHDTRAAILGSVDVIVDNAVALSAILLGVLVVGSLVVLGIAGLRLWRVVRAAQRRVGEAGAALAAEGERLQAAVDAMPARQAELQGSIESLGNRAAALGVLARSAGEAAAVLRAPLRYIGR